MTITTENLTARSMRYCAAAERCRQQVARKMREWGGGEEQITQVLNRLQEEGFLDEARFCEAFVHDKVTFQGWGRVKIHTMLQASGVSCELIADAMNSIDEDTYIRQLKKAAALKKTADRDKKIRFLLQRGYTLSEIRHLEDSGCDF